MRGLIGKPWAVPCNPPNSFDCWELVRHVREVTFNKGTPSIVERGDRKPKDRTLITNPPTEWVEIPTPEVGCVVRIGETHVGVFLGRGDVMHAQFGSGVRVDRLCDMLEKITFWEMNDAA